MSKVWLISDTHFNHKKIIEYCGRPIDHELLLLSSMRQIPSEDVLLHLGDICVGNDSWTHKILDPLVCKRWLIKGNHDRKSNSWYLEKGWDFVGTHIRDTYFGKDILFSHIPVVDNGYDLNIHGHFHNSNHRPREPELVKIKNPKQHLFSVELLGYKAMTLEHFINKTQEKHDK